MQKRKYNLKYIVFLSLIPIIGIIGAIWHSWNYGIVWQEPFLLLIFWITTGLGITVGYHRLFSHRSFTAHPILDWIMVIFGAAALENSALKWCSDHRRHHKHLDTDKDPYSITEGFFHAHIGWILQNTPAPIEKVQDLEENPALSFQAKYYYPLFIVFGLLLPVSMGFFWGRPLGALFWGVFLRITMVHHFTYFINSLCHYVGTKPYDSTCTSGDSWYVALLTFGEGFHNYHHKFQWDYRNGIRWFHFDPSKWSIWCLSKIGLASKLKKPNYIQVMKVRYKNMWDQIHLYLDNMPNNMAISYEEKLHDIKDKILSLEESWNLLDKKTYFQSNKILQKQKKILQFEYLFHLRSLSLILITIENSHY